MIHQRGKEAQAAKNKRFPLTCCWGRRLEGACSCPKSLSTPSRTSNWKNCVQKQWQAGRNSCRSTCSRSTLIELPPRARHNQNNRCSPVFNPSRLIIRTDTRMCSALEKQPATSPSLDCFRFHRTELQLQLRLFHPPYCTPRLVVFLFRSDFITLQSKKIGTNSSPDDDEEMLQLSEAIIRRVKWSYKSLSEQRGLKMLRCFEKFGNHLFQISSLSIAVSMTSQGCVTGELRRHCHRLSRSTAWKPDVG